jgi:hypothetical protein
VCRKHVRVHPWQADTGGSREVAEAAGGGVSVHPAPLGVEQDRPADPIADGVVDGPPGRRREGDEHDPGAVAEDAQDSVAVFFA